MYILHQNNVIVIFFYIQMIRRTQRFRAEAACLFPALQQVSPLHKLFQFLQVFVCIKKLCTVLHHHLVRRDRFPWVITFQTFRNVIMNHIANIGFCQYPFQKQSLQRLHQSSHQKIIPILRSCCRIHSGMISFALMPFAWRISASSSTFCD